MVVWFGLGNKTTWFGLDKVMAWVKISILVQLRMQVNLGNWRLAETLYTAVFFRGEDALPKPPDPTIPVVQPTASFHLNASSQVCITSSVLRMCSVVVNQWVRFRGIYWHNKAELDIMYND